jgi:penicillin-binding protein 1A
VSSVQREGKAPPRAKSAKGGGKVRRPASAAKHPKQKSSPARARLAHVLRRVGYWSAVFLIAFTGSVTIVVAYYASRLPPMADWTVPTRPPNVRILADNGALISNDGDSSGVSVKLADLPAYVPNAVLAIEDRRFYSHWAFDPIGLGRALLVDLRAGAIVEGGSTITQQLAKNLFLTSDRTFERKVQEVILAAWLEIRLSKQQILELYLNRVYFGGGAYGIDAAAHHYFGKPARDLTLAEAASIAGLLKAPSHYSPITNPDAAERRTQVVLTAMQDAGFITARDASLALSAPIKPAKDIANGSGRYVADWVMDSLPGFVGTPQQDIVVQTTIDLDLQADAAKAVATTLDQDGAKFGVSQGALVAIDPTGAVKALVGGRDYSKSQYDRAIDAHRQPGSAFKPFVYLTALEDGLTPNTIRIDQPISVNGWSPEDSTKNYRGPVSLTTALALSLNTVSVELTQEVGADRVVQTAHRLGITSQLNATPSISLGTSEVTPLELTAAYVPFSNGGRGIIPHVIDKITTASGKVLYQRAGSGPGQVIDPRYVAMMNQMMEQTLLIGTAKAAQITNWSAAGKTGTSQDYRDAWFVGYTGALTAGVWFGNDDGKPTAKTSGGNLPAITWQRFMTDALANRPVVPLPGDPGWSGLVIADAPNGYYVSDDPATAPPADGGQPFGGFFRRLFGG